jgi:hypothetical protein
MVAIIKAVKMSSSIPNNAGCAWPTVVGCDWWKKSPDGVCLDGRILLYDWNSGLGNARIGATGWWTGFIGSTCGGSDPYAYAYNANTVAVDVMQALADGVWSGSTSFGIYGGRITAAAPTSLQAAITQWNGIPFAGKAAATAVPVVGGGCPSTLIATATVYDDGSISIA